MSNSMIQYNSNNNKKTINVKLSNNWKRFEKENFFGQKYALVTACITFYCCKLFL